jgi:hypothetical protein
MKVDPFAPQLLIDYDLYCRRNGYIDFGTYMARWYAVTALIEAAEAEGESPFDLTVEDVERLCPSETVN